MLLLVGGQQSAAEEREEGQSQKGGAWHRASTELAAACRRWGVPGSLFCRNVGDVDPALSEAVGVRAPRTL